MITKTQKRFRIVFGIIAGLFALAIVSCGGGQFPEEGLAQPTPNISAEKPVAVIVTRPDVAVPDESFYLDGSGSYDPSGGTIASYEWSQTAGTSVTLTGEDQSEASFTVPNETTTLTFQLIVTNDSGVASDPASVNIAVVASTSTQPDVTPVVVPMTAVFVSATLGNDGNDGSWQHPVATIGRGITIAVTKSLHTVYVMEGTYSEVVTLASGVDLLGNVVSIDRSGNAVFGADGSDKTVISAPAGQLTAIKADNVSRAQINGFKIVGARGQSTAIAMQINNSDLIAIIKNIFSTPGQADAQCRDLEIKSSTQMTISGNHFSNSGVCDDYIAISVEDGDTIRIVEDSSPNQFVIKSSGSESYIKAIQAVGSDTVEISGSQIEDDGSPLKDKVVFTGIVISDVSDATIADNSIAIDGGMDVAGVSLRCQNLPVTAGVNHNEIIFYDAATKQSGVRITCTQDNGDFTIERNTMSFTPPSNVGVEIRGIDATSLLRTITLQAINNVILMPAAAIGDAATKTAIYLKSLSATSTVSAFYNTMLITGNNGEMHGVYSSQTNLPLNATGNIFLMYGKNVNNAAFSLPKMCAANFCAKDIVTNLFNSKFFMTDVKLIYYYDTNESQDLSIVNECDAVPAPADCTNGNVNYTGNVVDPKVKPSYFDFVTGELLLANQVLVKDQGQPVATVIDDINGKVRDVTPDIGATEY